MTDNAYKFWRKCRRDGLGKKVYLFKGDSTTRAQLIKRTMPDNTNRPDAVRWLPVTFLSTSCRPMP
ncbi:hypothetical protein FOC35_22660 [Cedecea sp. FDAARGOS_727]|nr:terminase gpA endonuclease subunit [Cedecea sp. FDAARGOS_727]QIX98310.1 hypothetical protein FOC35_22660 [Cedecea sp. FDAARGOS_727]